MVHLIIFHTFAIRNEQINLYNTNKTYAKKAQVLHKPKKFKSKTINYKPLQISNLSLIMRNKLYHLLTLAILFVVGISSGQAQKRYSVDLSTSLSVDEFTDQVFAINNGSLAGGSGDFIRGLKKSSRVTDDNLFQAEPVGSVEDGDETRMTYRLKKVSSGEYVINENGTFAYTPSQTRAWVFYVMEPTAVTDDELNADPATIEDFRNVTTAAGLLPNTYVLVDAKVIGAAKKNTATKLCTNGAGAAPGFSN